MIVRLPEPFGPFLALETLKNHPKDQKHRKKKIRVILDHFVKIHFFRFLATVARWENAIFTVILAILANFTILKIASTSSHRHLFIKNTIFSFFKRYYGGNHATWT